MESVKTPFKVGDVVSFMGSIGTVVSINAPTDFPIQVIFADAKKLVGFRANGKFFDWTHEAAIDIIEKEKEPFLVKYKKTLQALFKRAEK